MGNEYGRKKGRPRVEVLRRFWPTSIFITYSICGSKRGVKSGHTAMSSSCDSLTTSWWALTAKRMPISSGRSLRNECESSTWNCIPRKRDCWNLVGLRSTNGKGVEKGSRTHSILRCAHEHTGAADFSVPSRMALAPRAVAAQPERPRPVGSYAAPHRSLAACAFRLSSLSPAPHGRSYLRQEPDAVVPLVRIRGGGCEQS